MSAGLLIAIVDIGLPIRAAFGASAITVTTRFESHGGALSLEL